MNKKIETPFRELNSKEKEEIKEAADHFIKMIDCEPTIKEVEDICRETYNNDRIANNDEKRWAFSVMAGCYIGNVLCKKHNAKWQFYKDQCPIISFPNGFAAGWPPSRVYKRLKNGAEDNVYHWYLIIKEVASTPKDAIENFKEDGIQEFMNSIGEKVSEKYGMDGYVNVWSEN